MSTTFTLKDGTKMRTTLARRFQIVSPWRSEAGSRWVITGRTDSRESARKRARPSDIIVDTLTGDTVR